VKHWVFERGGRLVYLGGNGLNCDVEFLDQQTCIYRNDNERRMRQPNSGYESRFHLRHESEASLLGIVYDPRGIMTAAPYRVIDASHWAFAGTGVREGSLFGQESLHERVPGGASGHETDKLSKSSPPGARLLARGENPNEGGAEMVIFDAPGGGRVFSVGSITWVSSVLLDDVVSRVTRNVLQEFCD
jgi:N,N-dimethylformamidase